jgi:DNA-binding NarL/FixJ family response regulator
MMVESQEHRDLTARQKEIAWYISRGRTNQQIADELALSVRTVGDHVSNILHKLDFNSRTEIAVWVARNKIKPGEDKRRSN